MRCRWRRLRYDPDFQRQGLARWLLAYGLLQAEKEGADHAFLEVRAGNRPAQALYRQFGFEVVSERKRITVTMMKMPC